MGKLVEIYQRDSQNIRETLGWGRSSLKFFNMLEILTIHSIFLNQLLSIGTLTYLQDENLKHFIRTNVIHQLIGPKK